jgi:hypothetical protein
MRSPTRSPARPPTAGRCRGGRQQQLHALVIDTAQAALALGSSDVQARRKAAEQLASEPDAGRLPLIEKALAAEQDGQVRALLERSLAASLLGSDDASSV